MAEDEVNGPIKPIPQVPRHWFTGNLPDIDPSFFAKSYWNLADLYGDIFELDLGGARIVVLSNYELVKAVLDDDKFEKKVSVGQIELRPLVKDGLFTSHPWEENWFKAHRILMPVFGPLGVKKMFAEQLDIASQMILRWDRYGPDNEILCSDDFTRLAFDTIGLCAFNYRFNEFYSESIHPFAQQMADTMLEAGKRANRTRIETALRVSDQRKFWSDIAAQHKLCDEIVAERVKNPKPEINDLLNVMLYAKDPVTGEGLDHENIRYQMATFLIAGHETTSGTLAFLFYHLLRRPETYHKAQQEVDEVLGTDALTVEHLPKLKYIDAAIKETLRFCGPITLLNRHAKETTLIGGKHGRYEVHPEQNITLNLKTMHHDPAVWGDDADQFKPERMMNFSKIPSGAWKPFGVGMRACIGRAFAEQEMLINVALILQRFQVTMADPNYKLEYLSTMTIKPKDFKIKVHRRPGRGLNVGLNSTAEEHIEIKKEDKADGKPLLVVYGSNAGTCQAYAEEIVSKAPQFGFHGETMTMDSAVERLPTDRPVVVVTPSYEGKPADNAKKFVSWLDSNKDTDKLKGVKYALFGVGNSEWAQTFHKVPKQVDDYMQRMKAEHIVDTGFVDVQSDTTGPFEDWTDILWKSLSHQDSIKPTKGLTATITKGKVLSSLSGFGDDRVIVKDNLEIVDDSIGPKKFHMEVTLPEHMTYQTGDYLAILPINHREVVRRILDRFELNPDDAIAITDTRKEFLKSDTPPTVWDLLAARVELSTPITQRQLKALAKVTKDATEQQDILKMAGDGWSDTIKKRFSVLDVLEDHPSCALTFTDYLDMLKPMTARQYSISSSMLEHKTEGHTHRASITYDVHDTPAWSGHGRTFHGVASSYLADLKPGNEVRCTVRPTNAGFHLPKDVSVPIIMIASGTGISPMRGFIEERAAIQKARGTKLGPALLYFGCRDIDKDYIYRGQLEEWEAQGVVSLRPCFSRHGGEYKYTSDRLYAEREEVNELFRNGAKVFVCGSASKLGRSTAETCMKMHMEVFPGRGRAEAEAWLDSIREHRYVSDVFG